MTSYADTPQVAANYPRRRAVNLAVALRQTAARLPDHDALIHGDTRWSWRELDARVDALATELADRGIAPGDCVLLDGFNHPEYVQALYAVWRAGAVVAPINARLHPRDLVPIVEVCRPSAIIAHPANLEHVAAVTAALNRTLPVMWLQSARPGSVAGLAPARSPADDAAVWAGDPAWYFFTSGTSGAPKAAVLTHDQLGFVLTNHLCDLMPSLDENHRSLALAPLSHGAGVHLMAQVLRGAATVIPTSVSLDPAEVWALVERERVTNMFTVPTILKRLVEDDAVNRHDHDSLAHVVYAGAPMPSRDQRNARAVLGDVLVQYYGLAEVTGNITVLPPDEHDHPSPPGVDFGTCGFARTGMQIVIRDADGVAVPAGEAGEICVAGPAVFVGYLDDPAANEAAFRDGWFRTGDVGLLDEFGYLFITGRMSDMYISGGSNVHPREIEEKVLAHAAIREVVVFGMPDPTWGESGVAVCSLHDGSALEPAELRAWLKERMTAYKVPRHIEFWPELPRSAYGKIVRRDVRSNLLDRGWAAPASTSDRP